MPQEELKSQFTGREDVAQNEINSFLTNHFFGRSGKEPKLERTKQELKSCLMMKLRMLAEHGTLGILGLLILFSPL
jgi:hypothetical protein